MAAKMGKDVQMCKFDVQICGCANVQMKKECANDLTRNLGDPIAANRLQTKQPDKSFNPAVLSIY